MKTVVGLLEFKGRKVAVDLKQPVVVEPVDVVQGRGLDDVELATLEWVDWHNHRRLHSACHDLTPAEYELIHYGQHPALTEAGVSTT